MGHTYADTLTLKIIHCYLKFKFKCVSVFYLATLARILIGIFGRIDKYSDFVWGHFNKIL